MITGAKGDDRHERLWPRRVSRNWVSRSYPRPPLLSQLLFTSTDPASHRISIRCPRSPVRCAAPGAQVWDSGAGTISRHAPVETNHVTSEISRIATAQRPDFRSITCSLQFRRILRVSVDLSINRDISCLTVTFDCRCHSGLARGTKLLKNWRW